MKTTFTAIALALCSTIASAGEYPTIEFLPPGYLLTDLATGGTAGCGNVAGDGSYETFRWTSQDGVERLGRATVPAIGVGGGSPDISHDGNRISASILSTDNKQTLGIWDAATGLWTEAIPPLPPTGVLLDQTYASAWGLSGDGSTLTGFYYSNYSGPVRARPCTWAPQGAGIVNLPGNPGVSCRVNASNFDGTIVGGWEDHGGPWWPTIWRNGVKTNITDGNGGGGGRVEDVNYDGSILVGAEYSEAQSTRVATIWTWDGSAYVMNNLTLLPGTVPGSGQQYFNSVSNDGSIAVGSNVYTLNPGAARDGIVWTPSGGMVKASDFVASLGLSSSFSPTMELRDMTSVSPDGTAITGIVLETSNPAFFQTFVIRLAPPPCSGDADRNHVVNFADVTSVLANFGSSGLPYIQGDADGNANVNFADITSVLAQFDGQCP